MRLAEKKWIRAAGKLQRSSFLLRGLTLLVLSVLLVSASFAWIAMNSDTNSSNMGMNVDYDKFYVEANYYKYNPKEQIVESSADLTDVHFNQYDLVFRSRNRYTPIVAAIKMTGEDLQSSGIITITINRDSNVSGSYLDSSGVLRMSETFSTIMRFTAMVGTGYYSSDSGTLFNRVDSDTNYKNARAQTGNTDLSKVLTRADIIDSNGQLILTGVESGNVAIDVEYTSDDFIDVDGDGVKESLFVYLYITYDEGYISSSGNYNGLLGIYQKTSDTMGISAAGDISDTSVMFENDLISIRVSHSH